ncbi:MAG: type IV secretion system DNA-binding domain-containing protein, partial [Nitrospinae bacterium]|nr:type IV secretion system DNA-binding domain-containing protein [Nitrospinota bacterium]
AKLLKETKGGEAGYTHIQDASSKQALGVIAVMMQYVSCFKYMVSGNSGFSIQSWLNDDSKGRWIFVTNYSDVQDTLKPILSLFVDLLGRKLLSMNDDYDRRRFFLLDEFGTLNRLSTIIRLLTLSRSKGGSCWIGI